MTIPDVPKAEKSGADEHLNWVIDQLTTNYMSSTNPNVKQASVVFLLSILPHGQEHRVVKTRLAEIQSGPVTNSFSRFDFYWLNKEKPDSNRAL